MSDVLGAFEQAVLLAIARPSSARSKTDAYGRAILAEVQDRLGRQVSAGAVYATLDRLEQKGLVTSALAEGSAARAGRPRRIYSIEPSGIAALNEARDALARLHAGVRWPLKGPA